MASWFNLVTQVTDNFFAHEDRRLEKWIDSIIDQNEEIRLSRGNRKSGGFLFDGITYTHSKHSFIGADFPGSEPEIDAEMADFLAAYRRVHSDKVKIRQIAVLLLMPCATDQEARDALPDELAEAYPATAQISRQNPIDYSIFEDRIRKQLDELQDLIAFYSATRMIY